jgi:hypothetical protein
MGIVVAAVVLGAVKNAASLTEYDLGADKIPSVNAVIGETKNVTAIKTGWPNGVQYKEYTYKTNSMGDDLTAYIEYLRERGWLTIADYDFTQSDGEAKISINSVDEGTVLIMTLFFELNQYIIRIEKGKGTLTLN